MVENTLYEYMATLLRHTPTAFRRYMFPKINWESRMVGIIGPRGVGKSTMMLQRILSTENKSLYITADQLYFSTHRLTDLANEFVKDGGTHLYIDEVHKYSGWARELKEIYDLHPDLHLVFTGSSVLDIIQGESDLSRRALLYTMQGLSFREYLEFFHQTPVAPLDLEEILTHKVQIPGVSHPLPLFRDYLQRGYYPFSTEYGLEMRLNQIVAQTIEVDIPQYAEMNAATAKKLKKLLFILSQLAPFKPNADNLSKEIEASRNNIPNYLIYLEKAGMIGQLRDSTGGLRGLGKVEKIYLDNPNLQYALANGNPEVGNLRETFFYNQMRVNNDIIASRESDFKIGKYTFEVGGKKKGKKQIENVPNGIIVRDDIECGHGIIVPLWAFGLNY